MNFAQMLMMDVKPLPEVAGERQKEPFNRTPAREQAFSNMHDRRHQKSLAKYREVMGDKWMRTKDIQSRLGYAIGVSNETLRNWWQAGLVERRNYGGAAFNRKAGYEWRMKE